jgi:hypothetical protein
MTVMAGRVTWTYRPEHNWKAYENPYIYVPREGDVSSNDPVFFQGSLSPLYRQWSPRSLASIFTVDTRVGNSYERLIVFRFDDAKQAVLFKMLGTKVLIDPPR